MITGIILSVLGMLICVCGYANCRGYLKTFRLYNEEKLSDSQKETFDQLVGGGICAIGLGILLSGILYAWTLRPWPFVFALAGMLFGAALFILASHYRQNSSA